MHRKHRYTNLSARYVSTVSRWWRNQCLRWYAADKGAWIIAFILGLTVTAFGFLFYSLFSYQDDRRNLTCLALNVYFEARGEPRAGQYAVAEVTMNRVASGRYPGTVCGVVYQKNWDPLRRRYVGAFSWTEFDTKPSPRGEEWKRAWEAAEAVYYRQQPPELNGALFYHSVTIRPSWSKGKTPVARIGRHVFYK